MSVDSCEPGKILAIMESRHEAYRQRWEAQERALDVALISQSQAVSAALAAAEKAVNTALISQEKAVNNAFAAQEKSISLSLAVAASAGKNNGLSEIWGYLVGLLGIIAAIFIGLKKG